MKHKKILVFIIILATALIGLCTCGKDIISNSDLPPFMETEKEPEILRFVDVKGNWHEVEVLENVEKHPYNWEYLTNDETGISYVGDTNYTVRKGIDVSKWQGKIDWEQVKAAGYEFAFLRLGYRGYGTEGKMEIDSTFYYNIQNARKYGIDLGVYFFSQAINETEALEEANFVLSALEGYKLQLPIVYDPELISHDDARTDNVTGEQFTKNTITFCEAIKAAGYEPMVYSNMVWEATLFDMTRLQDYDFWYADYEATPQTPYDFTFWQYTESGKVPGTEGNVDLNLQFIPTKEASSGDYDFTLCFAGDISLDEAAVTTRQLNASENGIYGCISPELIEIMQQAELMCLNNEFTYSTNGSPMSGKAYTFRAHPDRVAVLQEMGVDIVTLANNHVYDYGKQAFLDTMTTLENADIDYFGAGKNLAEAMAPVYYEIDGKTIAFVGASRAEKNKMTPQATDTNPGILRCYDTELFLQSIKEADANADFVIAVVHWGTEYSTVLEDAQLTTGKAYLDAGADAIIGGHSHCLQGMEFYNNKPIIYSLGNYWFNSRTLDSMLVQLRFYGDDNGGNVEVSVVPAIQKNAKTQIVTDAAEIERIFSYLEDISVNVEIDENGMVTQLP
ncbi:MAG: CapA family protein [Agathobacter sp.]|nr:CapA family protein [Agathobacter sp.]